MKIKKVLTWVFYLCMLFVSNSCKKSGNDGPTPPPHPNGTIYAGITGRVTGERQEPVQGAKVIAGNKTATTDVNGYFSINNASLDKKDGYIKVEKEGYFLGSRIITPNEAATNFISIQLIKKYLSGSFTAGSGGTVNIASGGNILFPANGVVRTGGNTPYTGAVSVYAYFINPQATNFRDIMPGALRGLNTNGQVTGLKSYGMMAVELTGANGEALQLTTGKSASITFPIPSKLQASAPASVPLWHFNDTTGLWKQEGSATKQGTNYIGSVSHFSFWNCDDQFPIVDFAVTLKDQAAQPLRYHEVVLKLVGDTTTTAVNGFTDESGHVSGPVPMNKTMQMQVYNSCGVLLYSKQIGPYTGNTDLGNITINNSNAIQVTISGTVTNCNGNPVINGLVNILLDGKSTRTKIANGAFNVVIDRCQASAATAELYAIDWATNERTYAKNVSVTSGPVSGIQLDACGIALDQFIQYSMFGTTYTLLSGDNINAWFDGEFNIRGHTYPQQANVVDITVPANGVGTFPLTEYSCWITKAYVGVRPINVNITEFGKIDEFIAGNFTGIVKDSSTGATGPLVVSFRVRRLF